MFVWACVMSFGGCYGYESGKLGLWEVYKKSRETKDELNKRG